MKFMKSISSLSDVVDVPAKSARERILLTAHDLFYCYGIRATGIDRLIAESKVTKTTFYRHFPSKKQLIIEFLEYRHKRWMSWFAESLNRHGGTIDALYPTLEEWFGAEGFRGCAFINSLSELGEEIEEITSITQGHKECVANTVATLLPNSSRAKSQAMGIVLAIDGAIIRAHYDKNPKIALSLLRYVVEALGKQ